MEKSIMYGITDEIKGNIPEGYIAARITAVHKDRYEMVSEKGSGRAVLKSSIFRYGEEAVYPTAGDFAAVQYNESGESVIHQVLERKTYFSRNDPSGSGHKEQVVAANFDYVFIVSSLNQDLNLKRLERYLTLGWQSGAVPVILLTKRDLVEDVEEIVYQVGKNAVGVDIHAVSAVTGEGMEALGPYMAPGTTIALLGSSGVGKSSLVNAVSGEELMKVSGIRQDDARGRHTTTHRQLVQLENKVMFIDTPGMRELGMWDVSEGLGNAFQDVEQYFGNCRFTDCRHENEPGCALKQALQNGELSHERWESYQKLKREARYSEDKRKYFKETQKLAKKWQKESRNKKKYLK